MDAIAVAAALVSAILHAGWNAAIKTSPRPTEAMTAQMILSALMMVPLLYWTGLPEWPSWPWMAAGTFFNIMGVTAMLRAYELAGFGAVYPMVRALSAMLVVPLVSLLSSEMLRPWGLAGVGLIATALLLLAFGSRGPSAIPPRAILWIVLSGTSIAAVVTCDAQGVRQAGSPLAYGAVISVFNATIMAIRQRAAGNPLRIVVRNAAIAAPASFAASISFLLILWVYSFAPIAASSALRDTSAIFALLIAMVWLREPLSRLKILAVVLAAAAIPLLRLA